LRQADYEAVLEDGSKYELQCEFRKGEREDPAEVLAEFVRSFEEPDLQGLDQEHRAHLQELVAQQQRLTEQLLRQHQPNGAPAPKIKAERSMADSAQDKAKSSSMASIKTEKARILQESRNQSNIAKPSKDSVRRSNVHSVAAGVKASEPAKEIVIDLTDD